MRPIDHYPECPKRYDDSARCICDDRDAERIEDYQRVKPYTRPVSVPQTAPQGPYQSLASLIRAARTQGYLRPIQQYGGGTAPAP